MKALTASFRNAFRGLLLVCKTERNMKIHLAAAVFALILSGFLQLSHVEWLFVFSAIALVLMAETFNTAIEAVVDLVAPDYHPLAGKAKDVAAGAVLVAAIFAAIVALMVFGPRLAKLVGFR